MKINKWNKINRKCNKEFEKKSLKQKRKESSQG